MIVIDSHCDTAGRLRQGEALWDCQGHWSLKRATKYQGFVQFFAAFVSPEERDPQKACMELLDSAENEINKNQEFIFKASTYQEIEQGLKEKKIVALLTVEGGFGSDLSMIPALYKKGVRVMSLCWNQDTPLCGGVLGSGTGLTPLGKQTVDKMNELGMIVDVSHASDQSFYELAKCSKKPLIATHSNSRAICGHPRNLTDEQFIMIRDMDGMVGLNCYPPFLCDTGEADVNDFLRHVEHFLQLGGDKCIGLGMDFDGIDFCMKGINGIQDYEFLYQKLCHCFSKELAKDLFCENYIRFFKKHL